MVILNSYRTCRQNPTYDTKPSITAGVVQYRKIMGNKLTQRGVIGVEGVLLLMAMARGTADEPSPPVWPGRFHATIFQKRGDDLGIADLWYDFAAGRNLNIIQTQSAEEKGPLFDNEQANGTGYYYLPAKGKAKYCNVIDFGVGILKPNWLAGATYLGEETVGIYNCYKWEQGDIPRAHARTLGLRADEDVAPNVANAGGSNRVVTRTNIKEHDESWPSPPKTRGGSEGRFITYWSEKGSERPVKWVFFDGAEFEVIRFDSGATMYDDLFQIPGYCFSGDLFDEPVPSLDEKTAL